MSEITGIYADFIKRTYYETLTPETVSQAKKSILDTIGVSLAGYQLMEFPKEMAKYITGLGGVQEATIIGQKGRNYPAMNAALVNGAFAHALDMDDGHRFAASHPGAVIIPAAIATAQMTHASTRKLVAGVVVGYEVFLRVARTVNPSSLKRGFHTTGTVGPFGAAAACASIMDLSREETVGALGLAGLQGAGLMEVMHDNEAAKVKPFHTGKAAMAGVMSACLAKQGVRGPQAVLEGESGFLRATADDFKLELLTQGLGEIFEIHNTYIKFYPACRHTHVAIDATLAILRRGKIIPSNIKQIVVETYSVAIRLAGTIHPTTPSAARFSLPYCIAMTVFEGEINQESFSEYNIKNEDVQNLAGKVQLLVTDKWESSYPAKRGARVSIMEKNGKISASEMDLAIGEPENPATWGDLSRKFHDNATAFLSPDCAKKLEDSILNLENSSIEEFAQQLA